jgi:hypothetical protein
MPGVQATLASGDWLFRLRLTFSHASEHHSDSSNPTAFTGVFRCQTGDMQTPSDLATHRDSKNDSILVARREIQAPHDAMHRASMGATELQSNWPEMRKTQAAKRVAKKVDSRE